MTSHYENKDRETDFDEPITSPELPSASGPKAPSQMDVLGLLPGGGEGSPLAPLYKGSHAFAEWAPRGRRTKAISLAIGDIVSETEALLSARFPIRGDMMKRTVKQDSLRAMFTPPRLALSKLEFGALLGFMGMISALVFLVSAL